MERATEDDRLMWMATAEANGTPADVAAKEWRARIAKTRGDK